MLLSEHLKDRGVERRQAVVFASNGDWQEGAHPHQVVDSRREGKHPTDPIGTPMPGLAQSGDGLEPAEDLFHPFALDLTDGVARLAGGTAVDGAMGLLRHVRRDSMLAQSAHQFLLIVTLIGAERDRCWPAISAAIARAASGSAVPLA